MTELVVGDRVDTDLADWIDGKTGTLRGTVVASADELDYRSVLHGGDPLAAHQGTLTDHDSVVLVIWDERPPVRLIAKAAVEARAFKYADQFTTNPTRALSDLRDKVIPPIPGQTNWLNPYWLTRVSLLDQIAEASQ